MVLPPWGRRREPRPILMTSSLSGPEDAHVIDAVVGVKPGVLGGDDGFLQDVGDPGVRDLDPPLLGEFLDGLALVGQDRRDDLGLEVLELVDRREVVPDGHVGAEHGPQDAGRADGQDDEEDAEPAGLAELADLILRSGILILSLGIFMGVPGKYSTRASDRPYRATSRDAALNMSRRLSLRLPRELQDPGEDLVADRLLMSRLPSIWTNLRP